MRPTASRLRRQRQRSSWGQFPSSPNHAQSLLYALTNRGRRPRPLPSTQPITQERIKRALVTVAHVIATYGETHYLPLMERLEKELETFRSGRDPVSRARAILKAHAP